MKSIKRSRARLSLSPSWAEGGASLVLATKEEKKEISVFREGRPKELRCGGMEFSMIHENVKKKRTQQKEEETDLLQTFFNLGVKVDEFSAKMGVGI